MRSISTQKVLLPFKSPGRTGPVMGGAWLHRPLPRIAPTAAIPQRTFACRHHREVDVGAKHAVK